jgi:hypothetical protein
VAWSGAGISLGTSYPTPERVRNAVHEVLKNPTYRANARTLQANFAGYDALDRISSYVESYLRGGSPSSKNTPPAPLTVFATTVRHEPAHLAFLECHDFSK